ncbi:hypothetical protein M1M34_gp101 [Haloarcula tailed virus 2]|uniref:Uncharacterized protein n=1 Tax=Haloarcula tailed virus 2 TaxID=2877989 RepID=A0AAE8XZK9_9CAUD|nr:hypothetical protein M1M34_gp101 [Haloarcula tailed virus 2]UBF23232.1 hypothetical protein HATV-2_gp81 [Haloarcula tailed virus 2]
MAPLYYSMEGENETPTVVPIYEFVFESGLVRTTEHLDALGPEGAELLAEMGEADPDCDVHVIGYQA